VVCFDHSLLDMRLNTFTQAAVALLLQLILIIPLSGVAESLRFVDGELAQSFEFDTGILQGRLRPEGKSNGLIPVLYGADGLQISSGEGFFNHYRVFTEGKRYGYGARRWPSEANLQKDGSVQVVWQANDSRPFELIANYRWLDAKTLDVTTTVRALEPLKNFEVFMASYYPSQFNDSRVWATQENGHEGFVQAIKERGIWQVFPRDKSAAEIIADGRWDLEPHPLQWTFKSDYALPLAVRKDNESGITIVSMAQADQCFGVFTPYNDEKHYSNYFSIFGYDIAAGESAVARKRLVVLKDPGEQEILEHANQFFAEFN
jgi:hypothetical protein